VDILFALAVAGTLGATAVPPVVRALDDYRTVGAARYIATTVHRVRMEAAARSAHVALRFTATGRGYLYVTYVDGNGNGVRTQDIEDSIDRPLGAAERLSSRFAGVDFGVEPGLPPVEPGGSAPGANPIRLSGSNLLSFSPTGSSSSGSVYVRGPSGTQCVVRVLGDTGRTRVLRFDNRSRRWMPL
jgi:hypothetical protein